MLFRSFITPIQVGKIIMKHLQGWVSGITIPRYAANIEGGGGKVVLMPSGHDTLHKDDNIESRISESFADVSTWDNRTILKYEALGRATSREFDEAVNIMDSFIGRKGVFRPRIIIVDDKGNHLKTTNRTKLPSYDTIKKAGLLGYELLTDNMPLSNPALISDKIEKEFRKSSYNNKY